MKNELLSIGEAAKLKQVSVKSLRYYETIGILKMKENFLLVWMMFV